MKNRWLIALSAVGVHICIGSVYAWSVLTKPIMRDMGFSLGETTWAFSIAILFLGLSAAFLGPVVEQMGPRRSGFCQPCFSDQVCWEQEWRSGCTACRCCIFFMASLEELVWVWGISLPCQLWSNGFRITGDLLRDWQLWDLDSQGFSRDL